MAIYLTDRKTQNHQIGVEILSRSLGNETARKLHFKDPALLDDLKERRSVLRKNKVYTIARF